MNLSRDPLLIRRSVCAAVQPARPQVSRCTGLSVSDHEYPALTGRSGTQRGGQSGTRSGNSAHPELDQVVELLGHGIVPASGEEHVQPPPASRSLHAPPAPPPRPPPSQPVGPPAAGTPAAATAHPHHSAPQVGRRIKRGEQEEPLAHAEGLDDVDGPVRSACRRPDGERARRSAPRCRAGRRRRRRPGATGIPWLVLAASWFTWSAWVRRGRRGTRRLGWSSPSDRSSSRHHRPAPPAAPARDYRLVGDLLLYATAARLAGSRVSGPLPGKLR